MAGIKRRMIILLMIFALLLAGCATDGNGNGNDGGNGNGDDISHGSNSLLATAIEVVEILEAKDMAVLSEYVHPDKGVRITPYFHVDIQNDQVFTSQNIIGIMQDNQIINWGDYDGSGEPIELSFNDYFDKFIYDKDFANPHLVGNNVAIGKGNIIDNIVEAYPDGQFVEFHFSGFDTQYEGIDWESLRLVFEEMGESWYLVGIVHGQWTI